ncbi:MAG: hypothetical protein H7099_05980 [Gemmatimonadaceae bacterium]|nr:hypothetical protein [Gemmatimonadaceae bacterium]
MAVSTYLRIGAAVLVANGLSACYEYAPMQRSTTTNPRIEILLTDRGRVDLMPQLGQGVLSFEGTLDGRQDSSYVVRVAEVTYINRQTNRWSGEAITVTQESVRDIRVRRLSRARTFVVVATSVGAGVAFILSRGLLGFGSGSSDPGQPPPPQGQ